MTYIFYIFAPIFRKLHYGNEDFPVVCMDESPEQLTGTVREDRFYFYHQKKCAKDFPQVFDGFLSKV